MKDMENMQAERKQIRKRLDEAYRQHDGDRVVKTAKQLSEFAVRVINN